MHRIFNTIIFDNMQDPKIGNDFIVNVKEIIAERNYLIKLDFSQVKNIFPNTAVPIAGIVDYFQKNNQLVFEQIDTNNRIERLHLLTPAVLQGNEKSYLNKVWQFENYEQVATLVDELVAELRKTEQFETGVLDGISWSLNEVMDNVLNHSNVMNGFVMGQVHKQRKHVAFCVFDNGQGIYNSLKNSPHAPKTPQEALSFAVQESVTRDTSIGQGNGLYGLHQIVKYNQGRLIIISNSALYRLEADKIESFDNIPTISKENGGTLVDFQLDYHKKVSISEALIFKGKPYHKPNYYLEDLETENGELAYILKDWKGGVGSRQSGKQLRTEILNNYNETQQRILINFADLSVISSSFADELVGKLVIAFGFFGFNNIVRLRGMNEIVQQLVQRSVAQRMAESLNNQ
jgi:hypothetical protein